MKNKPLISIIVPVFNAEEYLAQCLDSILNQTYRDLEILCINDGSCDGSIGILKKYKNRDSRIVIIDKQNEGVSATRNVGLRKANGDYLMFVDADDWLEETVCEQAVRIMNEKSVDIVLWPYIKEFNNSSFCKHIFDGNIYFSHDQLREKLYNRLIGPSDEDLRHLESADSISTVWGKLYKKDIVVNNNISFVDLKQIGTYEDGLFNIQYFSKINSAYYLNEYLYHYRKNNANSIITKYIPNQKNKFFTLFSLIEDHLKGSEDYDYLMHLLNNRICFSVLGLGLNAVSAPCSVRNQYEEIRSLLNDERIKKAFLYFKTEKMTLKWKVFYNASKLRCYFIFFLLIKVISFLIRKGTK